MPAARTDKGSGPKAAERPPETSQGISRLSRGDVYRHTYMAQIDGYDPDLTISSFRTFARCFKRRGNARRALYARPFPYGGQLVSLEGTQALHSWSETKRRSTPVASAPGSGRPPPLIEQICDADRDSLGAAASRNLEKLGAHSCRDDGTQLRRSSSNGRFGSVSALFIGRRSRQAQAALQTKRPEQLATALEHPRKDAEQAPRVAIVRLGEVEQQVPGRAVLAATRLDRVTTAISCARPTCLFDSAGIAQAGGLRPRWFCRRGKSPGTAAGTTAPGRSRAQPRRRGPRPPPPRRLRSR
jgi:hypothetical protein